MEAVLTSGSLDIAPGRIIYDNPCKQPRQLCAALSLGVDWMTFDNIAELTEIQAICPGAKLMMRILPDASNCKYGANQMCTTELLHTASLMGLQVMGVYYHVSSGQSFVDALYVVRAVFDITEQIGFRMTTLDIRDSRPSAVCFVNVAPVLDILFPPSVRIISSLL